MFVVYFVLAFLFASVVPLRDALTSVISKSSKLLLTIGIFIKEMSQVRAEIGLCSLWRPETKGLNDVELIKVFDRLYNNQDLQRILKILQEIYDTEVSSMEWTSYDISRERFIIAFSNSQSEISKFEKVR